MVAARPPPPCTGAREFSKASPGWGVVPECAESSTLSETVGSSSQSRKCPFASHVANAALATGDRRWPEGDSELRAHGRAQRPAGRGG